MSRQQVYGLTAASRIVALIAVATWACAVPMRMAFAAGPNESVMLVLDASGSMWGKVEGRHKIEVAREAVAQLLDGWGDQRHLGLIAYGHRRKGDCNDIETLMPVGPLDAPGFKTKIDSLNPKGKTPITASVRAAAQALRFREERATVILVSDGVETCDADPCALGKELEAAGVDFTTHVIGFDLVGKDTESLACLARATGGKFIIAANADQLQAAVEVAAAPLPPQAPVVAKPAKPPATYTFEARDGKNGPVIRSDLTWLVKGAGEPPTLDERLSDATPSVLLPLGEYTVQVTRAIDNAEISKRFRVTGSVTRRMRLVLPAYTPAATLDASPSVVAGAELDVEWTGPNLKGDYITLVAPDAKQGKYGPYVYTKQGSPVTLRAPDEPGTYELRYTLAASKRTAATRSLTVTASEATVSAPADVAAGGRFEVEWTGPNNKGDYVTIVAAGAKEGRYRAYRYTKVGSPLELKAPDEPGDYEVRYVTAQAGKTLARQALAVGAVEATLSADAEVLAGSSFEVQWSGPNNKNDYVTVVPIGAKEGKAGPYGYTKNGSPLEIRAPDIAGDYELRYAMGQSRKTLARRALRVGAASATLSAAAEVAAGSSFAVEWTGPNNKNDYVTIVPVGAKERKSGPYAYTKRGSPLEIKAPDEPGEYELRYAMGKTRNTIARRTIRITPVSATLTVAPQIAAGSAVEVEWSGPNNKNDFIAIAQIGAKRGVPGLYAYTKKGSPSELQAPDEAGDYEVRYVMGKSRTVLKRQALQVTAVSATLQAQAEVAAGERFEVEWSGPNNKNDFITIVPIGSKERKSGPYSYTKMGSPLDIKAPKAIGDYELRYVMGGRSKKTLSRRPLRVVAP